MTTTKTTTTKNGAALLFLLVCAFLGMMTQTTLAGTTNQVEATVTAYCGCAKCCGKSGQPTASGKMPKQGVTVAGPRSVKLGTKVQIEGLGERIVQDRTAKKYDGRIDVFFNDHKEALKFGIKHNVKVTFAAN